MGRGDIYHKHPLRQSFKYKTSSGQYICFRCSLPITDRLGYTCDYCNFNIHKHCYRLPETIWYPLHNQHPLILSTLYATSYDNPATNFCCNKCQKPLLEGYAYHCPTCQFTLHLGCIFRIDHKKHHHPLLFRDSMESVVGNYKLACRICGRRILNFNFGCRSCDFYIHYHCSLIPPTIKHYHVHELTISHNFPEECEQVLCDRCEDRHGQLDPSSQLSYYYCQKCDYIAHVPCIIPRKDDLMTFKRFTHQHLLGLVDDYRCCCNQCDYSVGLHAPESPTLIKHPSHPEHTLNVRYEYNSQYECTVCEFKLSATLHFVHPYGEITFHLQTDMNLFICDICGDYGTGSRMADMYLDIDIHLQCFALPGKLEHRSHPHHLLYLSSSSSSFNPFSRQQEDSRLTPSTCHFCNVCNKEIAIIIWFYCCLDCNFVAHVTCVADDLLSTLLSSIKNQPDFCAIIEPDIKSFELQIAKTRIRCRWPPAPLLKEQGRKVSPDLAVEEVDDTVCCPQCNHRFYIPAKDSRIP